MSTMSLRLPDSLHNEIRKLAQKENVSINHLVTLALAEKISVLETEEYLQRRASRADIKKFLRAMAKVADRDSEEYTPERNNLRRKGNKHR